MTLIIALGNPEHTVLVADRLHSSDEGPVPGEFTKAIVLELADARLAVAFTGLATGALRQQIRAADAFRTRFWLVETLSNVSGPNPTMEATVAGLAASASRDIIHVPVDKPADRALTIFLAGYLYRSSQPTLALHRVSNLKARPSGVQA